MSLYPRKLTVFGPASPRLIEIAVIVTTFLASTFAAIPTSSGSLIAQLKRISATVRNNPIQCEVSADVKTDAALLACKFPMDIDAYQMGFYIQADNANQEEKEFSQLIITCYWENTPTTSLQCLSKDNSKANQKYEKGTNQATLSIPMAAARSYKLSCHLSSFTLQSRPCQLLKSVHQSQMSCNWCTPVVGVSIGLLLLSVCFNAILLFMKCECGANNASSLWTACKNFCKTSQSSSATCTFNEDNPESHAMLPEIPKLFENKPDLSPSSNMAKYCCSHPVTGMQKVPHSRPGDSSSGENNSNIMACTTNGVPPRLNLEQLFYLRWRYHSKSDPTKRYTKSPSEKVVTGQGEPLNVRKNKSHPNFNTARD